jgi:Na+/H+ antiporter NhaD/arsenite permease-like protein
MLQKRKIGVVREYRRKDFYIFTEELEEVPKYFVVVFLLFELFKRRKNNKEKKLLFKGSNEIIRISLIAFFSGCIGIILFVVMLTSGNFLPRVISISILLQRHSQTLTV